MSDQRHAPRLTLSMTVQLIARGISRRSCRMKDISPGGALLELPGIGEAGALKRGDVVIMRMFLGQGEDVREHELRGRQQQRHRAQLVDALQAPGHAAVALR